VELALAKGISRGLATSCLLASLLPVYTSGAPLDLARVNAVIHEVDLVPTGATGRPALLSDKVGKGSAMRTGPGSRAELTFDNQTVARLGENTFFKVRDKRECDLVQGAVLVQAPSGAKAVTIRAGDVATAISGITGVLEHHPGVFKFLVLEGTGRVYRPGHLGDSVLVHPGQMVFGSPNAELSDPVDFVLDRFLKTCRLIHDFPPLPSEQSIVAASLQQRREKAKKTLLDTNLVIFGGGTALTVTGSSGSSAASAKDSESALPAPIPMPNLTPAQTLAELRR
jgi:mannose-6-phosphate isomerase-like protein (cupin superfamily)